MTFEERIDKLTERHEALAQSVELLALRGGEQSKNLDKLIADNEKTRRAIDTLAADGRESRREVLLLMQSVKDLVAMSREHETRIQGLEAA